MSHQISIETAAFGGLLLLMAYYTAMALIGAMPPPALGEERTRYAYWYRVAQLLAANIHRVAEQRFGDLAGPTSGQQIITASRTEIIAAGPSADGTAK